MNLAERKLEFVKEQTSKGAIIYFESGMARVKVTRKNVADGLIGVTGENLWIQNGKKKLSLNPMQIRSVL